MASWSKEQVRQAQRSFDFHIQLKEDCHWRSFRWEGKVSSCSSSLRVDQSFSVNTSSHGDRVCYRRNDQLRQLGRNSQLRWISRGVPLCCFQADPLPFWSLPKLLCQQLLSVLAFLGVGGAWLQEASSSNRPWTVWARPGKFSELPARVVSFQKLHCTGHPESGSSHQSCRWVLSAFLYGFLIGHLSRFTSLFSLTDEV